MVANQAFSLSPALQETSNSFPLDESVTIGLAPEALWRP